MRTRFFYFAILLTSPSLCHGQLLNQLGDSKDGIPIIIDAEESVVCDERVHKCVATGLASARKGTSIVYGDVLTVYFTEGKKREITSMTAEGHVRMETPNDTAYAEHAHYDVALDRIILTGGNLKIVTPHEVLTARDSIEYYQKENKGIARGDAIATFPEKQQSVQADTLVAYFAPAEDKSTEGTKRKITSMTAEGHVLMETRNDKAYAEHAHYDVGQEYVILTGGNLKIVTPHEVVTARDSIEYFQKENKGVAKGNAIARFPEKKQLVQADTLIAYFKPAEEKAADGQQKQSIERIEVEGNTLVSGPKGVVTGERGIYREKEKFVEVFKNVKLTQEENLMKGEYAKFNLETNVAELFTQPPNVSQTGPCKRIHGLIMPGSVKKQKQATEGGAPSQPQ